MSGGKLGGGGEFPYPSEDTLHLEHPEWICGYEEYLDQELPRIVERLRCLREDPSHHFVLDQVSVLKPLLERFPQWHSFIRRMVEEGRIEPSDVVVQGNWSLLSGEMIVRNLTLGRRMFEDLLGIKLAETCAWKIDAYGLTPQLPRPPSRQKRDAYRTV